MCFSVCLTHTLVQGYELWMVCTYKKGDIWASYTIMELLKKNEITFQYYGVNLWRNRMQPLGVSWPQNSGIALVLLFTNSFTHYLSGLQMSPNAENQHHMKLYNDRPFDVCGNCTITLKLSGLIEFF